MSDTTRLLAASIAVGLALGALGALITGEGMVLLPAGMAATLAIVLIADNLAATARAAEDDEPPCVDEGCSTAFADAPDHHRPGLHADQPRTQDQLFDETDVRHRIGFTTARPPTTGRRPRCLG